MESPQDEIIIASTEIDFDEYLLKGSSKSCAPAIISGGFTSNVRPQVQLKYNLNQEKVVSWMAEDNVYEIIYERNGLTRKQVDDAINQELQRMQSAPVSYNGSLSECTELCNDKYTNTNGTKKKGRGECKFYCIMDWLSDQFVKIASSYKKLMP